MGHDDSLVDLVRSTPHAQELYWSGSIAREQEKSSGGIKKIKSETIPRGGGSTVLRRTRRHLVMATSVHSRGCERVGLLLLLCAVVPGASAERQNATTSGADRRTVRESAAIEPWLVKSDEGLDIIGAALESRHTDVNAACSNLVHEIYQRAGFSYPYANSNELYQGIKEFHRVVHPQPGDLVVWHGHVGIMISPVQHSFFSAMRSGRGVEFYDSPYWQGRGKPRFFRYLKAASRTQLSASARKVNLNTTGLRNTASHDVVPAEEDSGATSAVSSAQKATGTSVPGRSGDKSASGGGADASAPAEVSKANSPTALPTPGPQASLHSSESQTAADAQSAVDQNKRTLPRHKLQNPEDGVWEKTATKPSAGIPFDAVATTAQRNEPQTAQKFGTAGSSATSAHAVAKAAPQGGLSQGVPPANGTRPFDSVATTARRYEPQPAQGFGTANSAATSARAAAKASPQGGWLSPGGLSANVTRPQPREVAISRYVPRPPWSLP